MIDPDKAWAMEAAKEIDRCTVVACVACDANECPHPDGPVDWGGATPAERYASIILKHAEEAKLCRT